MTIANVFLRMDIARITGVRHLSTKPKFGLLFDIDGVIIRGKQILSPVKESFKRLQGNNGKFRVPTLFVTNSGNSLRSQKAIELSKWIGIEVMESQVVLAHSPLQMFDYLHNKQVLISGQGPITDIARELGFKKTITIEEVVKNFPCLDYINIKKRNPICGPVNPNFPQIEGILLLSEPIKWETSLQLMVDLLVTNGMPTRLPTAIPYPHIPVLACNMDLLWASEAPIPRYGHGAFLLCLENLYKKVTNKDMTYAALVGKPSEITYYHANQLLVNHARSLGIDNIDTIYAIGDNINTDIFGANLYDKYLSRYESGEGTMSRSLEKLLGKNKKNPNTKACISILVETGVHQRDSKFIPEHSPRDFLPVDDGLCKPAFIVKDVGQAINLAFKEEKFE
ncbi:PREDICTED: cat eye syndrome critical region protein 5 homolog [Acromyrmex echinatior]|uniref:Cat eye syndrome critical region protein 5-like protein n=1 Tax=Acromyrmex echinatior TaxID=103372 RepID=F4W7V4_ACREC|nr:PREDICTED: cat eye syndrome critical region protein 5 homolog [Acromyrmex echinatior]EGI69624.1 Cat eye syndrome critical region protein 5-like protein [Acromyrmex echinatior]